MAASVIAGLGVLTWLASDHRARWNRRYVALTHELEILASTDHLTGCLNHRAFNDRVIGEIARAVRHGYPLSLVVADVDDFKRVNDTHGHPAGDAALELAGATLRERSRSSDVVGRIGGDEFALLLPEMPLDAAARYAQRVFRPSGSGTNSLTFSAGVAALDLTEPTAEHLFERPTERSTSSSATAVTGSRSPLGPAHRPMVELEHEDRVMTRAWRGYLLAGIPLTITYLWLPAETAKLVVWPIIGWSSVIAILIGVRINRPPSPRAWYLLAAGVATLIMGDNLYSVPQRRATRRDAVPVLRGRRVPGDVPAADRRPGAARPPPIGGSRPSRRHRRRHHHGRAWGWCRGCCSSLPTSGSTASACSSASPRSPIPLGDVALLAIAARLAVGGGRRPLAFWLLAGSLVPLLAADALYGYLNLSGDVARTQPGRHRVDRRSTSGWGAAALHPSMRALSIADRRHAALHPRSAGPHRRAPCSCHPRCSSSKTSAAMSPTPIAIAVASAVLFVLVLIRTSGLARDAADVSAARRGSARSSTTRPTPSSCSTSDGRVRYQTPSTERVLGRVGGGARRPAAQ